MSSADQDSVDRTFERTLLESARLDELSPERTREAWATFASAAAALSLTTKGLRGGEAVRAARLAATKWLVVGALGGSALTATLMSRHDQAEPARSPAVTARVSATTVFVGAPPAVVSPPDEEPVSPRPETRSGAIAVRATPRAAASRHALRETTAPPDSANQTTTVRSSTLAAEVSAIDAARKASSAGEFDAALRLIDGYHRDFPNGELCADADVVAIDALAEKGDRAAVVERATQFLGRYPNDPHAAGVKALVAP